MFDDDVANYDVTFAELRSGWGIVTSSDIVLAWLIGERDLQLANLQVSRTNASGSSVNWNGIFRKEISGNFH